MTEKLISTAMTFIAFLKVWIGAWLIRISVDGCLVRPFSVTAFLSLAVGISLLFLAWDELKTQWTTIRSRKP